MEQIKRKRQNDFTDNNKKKKLIFNSDRDCFTHLEDLSNELFYEIFDYLDIYDVYEAFSKVNSRFENLLNDPTLPIRISLSFISKSRFEHYNTNIIIPFQYRITLLHLSNPLVIEHLFSPISILLKFIRLENLHLRNIESKYFQEILIHLISLPCLYSLIVSCTDNVQNKNVFYHQIFRLSVLKYCKLSLTGNSQSNSLSMATTEFSPIEYFIINQLYVDELYAFLSYLPQIRRLSIRNLYKSPKKSIREFYPIVLNHLIHVSLNMIDVNFDEFQFIIKNLFNQIEILYISTKDDRAYIDANQWQELILFHLPNLRIFDIQHKYSFNKSNYLLYDSLPDKFNSLFWFKRKWFFEHHIYHSQNDDHAIFFSTNPYRRKQHILCEETNKNINRNSEKSHIHSVNHLLIQTKKAVINCQNYFPNVTEITLFHNFIHESKNSLSNQFKKIFPLKQLTKLVIHSNLSCFSKMIELLRYIPYIHTLNIELLSFDDPQRSYHLTNSYVLQQNETFRLVSRTNNIQNLTIISSYEMELVQFFVNLCPRLKHLTINRFGWWRLGQFLQFLLSKTNKNTRHLVSLCVENVSENDIDVIRSFIEAQKDIFVK
ncbi:unnamed protein product [Rotaria sordida]|uniref:F-box domain-containing protein n=1 Tax=Rotaria sordida TaxID=392033 RepID=A0A818XYJ9_9BILA|nr:unnamed protein product [Rotaria sordida]